MTGSANLDSVVPAAFRGEPTEVGSSVVAPSIILEPRRISDAGASFIAPGITLVHHALGPEAMADVRTGAGGRVGLAAAAAVAVLAHVGLLLALERTPHGPVGAGGFDIEAVSIEVALLPATAIESRAQTSARAAAAGETVKADDGSETAQPAAAASAPAVKEAPPPPAAAAPALVLLEAKPEPESPDRPALPAAERMPTEMATRIADPPPEPRPATKVESKDEPPPVPAEKAVLQKPEKQERAEKPDEAAPAPQEAAPASVAATQGGAAARAATSEQRPTAGAAAASRGQIAAYARSVVGALARSAPKGGTAAGRGTVHVVFAIAADGGIEDVRVKQSSGRPRLDELAVAAVRGTRFPAPPAGMTLSDRTYEVPYHFR